MPDNDNVNQNTETNQNTNTTGSQIDFEALIAKARQDEKNKLYPEIEKLKGELTIKTEKMNALLLSGSEKDDDIKSKEVKIAELEKKIADLEEKEGKHVETSKEQKELEKKVAELEKQLADKDAEISRIALESYRKEKSAGLDESVVDLVSGSTKEEIDASVVKAKALFEKISAKFGGVTKEDEKKEETSEKKEEEKKPDNKIPLPNVNLNDSEKIFRDAKPEDFRDMDISTPEGRKHWEKMRVELGIGKKR